jgi:hypothetical protein
MYNKVHVDICIRLSMCSLLIPHRHYAHCAITAADSALRLVHAYNSAVQVVASIIALHNIIIETTASSNSNVHSMKYLTLLQASSQEQTVKVHLVVIAVCHHTVHVLSY